MFVKKDNSKKAWVKFEVTGRYANSKALKALSNKFEHGLGVSDSYSVRMKKRFNWDIHKPIEDRKRLLNKYHGKVRNYLYYIYGFSLAQ